MIGFLIPRNGVEDCCCWNDEECKAVKILAIKELGLVQEVGKTDNNGIQLSTIQLGLHDMQCYKQKQRTECHVIYFESVDLDVTYFILVKIYDENGKKGQEYCTIVHRTGGAWSSRTGVGDQVDRLTKE